MFRAYSIIVSAVLLISFSSAVYGQENDWNEVLDRYEVICSRSTRWRGLMAQNKSVPRDSLADAMRELNGLKERILWKRDSMTPGQWRRYLAIRDKYFPGRKAKAEDDLLPMPDFNSLAPASSEMQDSAVEDERGRKLLSERKIHYITGLIVAVPDFSAGALAGIGFGRFGLFGEFRSNFKGASSDYDCLSDGTTEGGYVWSGGEAATSRLQMSLNLSYRLFKPLSVYAGCGYGRKVLLWKDSAGNWARVSDLSYDGISFDAGIMAAPFTYGRLKGLHILAGATYISGGYFDFEAGLVWKF